MPFWVLTRLLAPLHLLFLVGTSATSSSSVILLILVIKVAFTLISKVAPLALGLASIGLYALILSYAHDLRSLIVCFPGIILTIALFFCLWFLLFLGDLNHFGFMVCGLSTLPSWRWFISLGQNLLLPTLYG